MNSILKNKSIELMDITSRKICDRCLGRNLSREIPGDSNKAQGEYIRENYLDNAEELVSHSHCQICFGLFDHTEMVLDNIERKIEDLKLEFSTFLVGCRLSSEIMDKEKEIHNILQLEVESVKKEFNRELGKKLFFRTGKEVEFNNPQLVIMADMSNSTIDLQINPLFLEGRYRKLKRGIPQTKWPCRKCKGKGCEYCNQTGKMYPESVEEIIAPEVLKDTRGVGSKFHGAGREDIDVRMLGNGRPFVLEIKEPKKRSLDLKELQRKINFFGQGKVEVKELKTTFKERRAIIKNSSTDTQKTYRAIVDLEEDISKNDLQILKTLNLIKQRTPLRVSHRRADKVRERHVKELSVEKLEPLTLELVILCEGGLYIKELISGDNERTQPSVSSLLGVNAECVELDVIDVNL